jgi:hypothetical protein
MYILWVECREKRTVDADRRRLFRSLDGPCLTYMRHTKDRPSWRIAWLCACTVTVLSTLVYAACGNLSTMNIATFCLLIWVVSFTAAHGALSYFTWHILCPHYSCSQCETHFQNSEE